MGLFPASLLVLIYSFPYTSLASTPTSSGTVSLPSEVSRFIPTCAQKCFESFVELNFPISACGTSPTLDCLCSHNSTSGFTAGEGALQCLIGEDSVDFCTGKDTSSESRGLAYNICFGRAGMVTPTHQTITATIIIQTPAPSTTATTTSSISSSSSTNSSSITTSRPSSSASATTGGIATASGTPFIPATTTTPSSQSSSTAPPPTPVATGLTKAQIAGITVGSIGGVALAVGTLLLFACIRRRKPRPNRDSDSDMLPFQSPNSMEIGFRGPMERKQNAVYAPGGTRNGIAAKVGPRTPSPQKAPQVPPRVMTDPTMFSRRTIRPDEIGLAISPDTKPMQQTDRDFADRQSSKLLPEKPTLKLLTTPQPNVDAPLYFTVPPGITPTNANTSKRESDATVFEMDSAVTPYEASRRSSILGSRPRSEWQNTPLASSITAPAEAAIRPLNIRKSGVPLPQLNTNTNPQSFSQPRTAASSIYSAYPSYVSDNSNYQSNNTPYNNNYNSGNGGPWQTRRAPPNSSAYKQYHPYAPHESGGSLTSFESERDMPEPRTPAEGRDLRAVELSPVQESPVGKSPVSYPKIPGRLSDPAMRDMWAQPPPEQPIFGPGRRTDVPSTQSQMQLLNQRDIEPWRRPEVEAARARMQANQSWSHVDEGGAGAVYETLAPVQEVTTRTNSQASNYSMKSTSSSLLAKRRERNGKAAQNLSLASPFDITKKEKAAWRVVNGSDIDAAKSPTWRPKAGRQNDRQTDMVRTELPSTPGWVPRLTPTRRGDELFLSVR